MNQTYQIKFNWIHQDECTKQVTIMKENRLIYKRLNLVFNYNASLSYILCFNSADDMILAKLVL